MASADIVNAWFNDRLRGAPLSLDTPAYNQVVQALPDLVARLEAARPQPQPAPKPPAAPEPAAKPATAPEPAPKPAEPAPPAEPKAEPKADA